ncbi:unnamed protein product [Vicia faba]|uniref:beta-ketoacyl-[acyl-carrier-protein] synthase I n=1 Tax=Vicia faba TaxID=3906 RepID=A0AAV0YZ34_VICFA|nr:unnamed protein product [Vicia faba]
MNGTKSMIGHCLGAAAGLEAISTIKPITSGWLHPTINQDSACTIMSMITTLPVVQLFFFHILLIKKGLITYDYVVAMRELEQEQEQLGVGGHQSPQMSTVSSFTGLINVSSFNALHRGAWCTPPRMFLEDQHLEVMFL